MSLQLHFEWQENQNYKNNFCFVVYNSEFGVLNEMNMILEVCASSFQSAGYGIGSGFVFRVTSTVMEAIGIMHKG